MKYPKINSLYMRENMEICPETGKITYLNKGKGGNKLIEGKYACAEFESIKYWTVTEKIDGTNIRIEFSRNSALDSSGQGTLYFGGRTDAAQIPADLYAHLISIFTKVKILDVFPNAHSVVIMGEGYGGKIQVSAGYRAPVSFVVFDVFVDGWWLKVSDVHAFALKFGIKSVPLLMFDYPDGITSTFIWTKQQILEYVKSKPKSDLEIEDTTMEGIVARSEPMMMFRNKSMISESPLVHANYHEPIMFKLKCKDFD